MAGPLANDLFFMLRDPYSGKARLSGLSTGSCLAAALLCELLVSDHLRVVEQRVALVDRVAPTELLAQTLVDRARRQLFTEPPTVTEWLTLLRGAVAELVADRLVREGAARRAQRRRLGRAMTVLVAADPARCESGSDRLAAYLRNGIAPDQHDVTLAALVMLSGPRPDPLELDAAGKAFLAGLAPALPADLQEVLARTERLLVGGVLRPS